ncbi:MAG: hypothetical protein ACPGUV_12725 [Polyangiales bacterium]
MSTPPHTSIPDLLQQAGFVTAAQVEQAQRDCANTPARIHEALIAMGAISEAQLTQVLSNQLSIPWVSLTHVDFARTLLDLIPAELALELRAVPVYARRVAGQGETLFVAIDDPTNTTALARIARATGKAVKAMVAPYSELRTAIARCYGVEEQDAHTATTPAANDAVPPVKGSPKRPPTPPPAAIRRTGKHPRPPQVATPPQAPDGARSTKTETSTPLAPENAAAPTEASTTSEAAPKTRRLTLLDGTTIQIPLPTSTADAAPTPSAEPSPRTALSPAFWQRLQGQAMRSGQEPAARLLLEVLVRKGMLTEHELLEALQD